MQAEASSLRRQSLCGAFFLVVIFQPAAVNAQNWSELRERVRGSIVHIESVRQERDGTNREPISATGFIVSCSGHVLTAAHAVPRPTANGMAEYRASVGSRHAPKMPLEVVTRDENLDLALLLLPKIQPWKQLEIVDRSADVPEDARLYALGFPLTSDLASVEGRLSSHFGVGGKWQTTLALNFGNSGGPVFDIAGKVVGMAVGGFDQAQGITYVIPADYLQPLRSLAPSSCSKRSVTPEAPKPAKQISQTFPFSVTVDHEEKRDVNELFCLPSGFVVSGLTHTISSLAGDGTRLISVQPVVDRPNCAALQAFVKGHGVDRLGSIIINHRGRGWLAGQIDIQGRQD